ncbi:MAG: RlmE family RNA methyltransferase [Nitrososphaeraceae archaeon]
MKFELSKRDQFRKLAKHKGYRSRSAFKLKQINGTYRIFKKGNVVVDIGCSPGGWLQIALEEVGHNGKVVGIDLKKLDPIEGVIFLHGSIEDEFIKEKLNQLTDSQVDVILSDIAPNLSGNWEYDHARQIFLTKSVLELTKKISKRKSKGIFKVFQGDMLNDLIIELRNNFENVIISKPLASRPASSELYLVCLNFIGRLK